MADGSLGDEDEWVKQALVDAIFGPAKSGPQAPTDVTPPDSAEPPSEVPVEPEAIAATPEATTPHEPAVPQKEPVAIEPGQDGSADQRDADPATGSIRLDVVGGSSVVAPASRLFESPRFDATNDPGVDEMVEAEPLKVKDLDPIDDRTRLRGALEWIVVLGSAVVVAMVLRTFLFQAFFIPSESMEATLLVDDRILVNKLSYRFGDVERGEVVVFRRPDGQVGEFQDLIKRVIGLPGETVEARNNTIYIDGQVLIEPYLAPGEIINDFAPVEIPEGHYFVMGDNRDNSGDSRLFGPIEEDRLIGRAFFLFWPLDRVGSL